MKLYIHSVSLFAPGCDGWSRSQEALKAVPGDLDQALPKYQASFLPANERRRLTPTLSFALHTADDLLKQYQEKYPTASTEEMAALFFSADGDTEISYRLCKAVTEPMPQVSPILFHNSVHNAAVGYWMIGQSSHAASTSIATSGFTVGQTLLEGYLQSHAYQAPVLTVAYDYPVDQRIPGRPSFSLPFAFGLILSGQPGVNDLAVLELSITDIANPISNDWPDKENPAAQAWPLLQQIAQQKTAEMTFPLSTTRHLQVKISFI